MMERTHLLSQHRFKILKMMKTREYLYLPLTPGIFADVFISVAKCYFLFTGNISPIVHILVNKPFA